MGGMETIQRPPKDFDLPTKHLGLDGHFVPPKARDEEEIARRRDLAPGTLVAEFQQRGLAVASTILKFIERPEDIHFSSRVLAASGINTAWYAFARGAEGEVMRRRLKLPYLAAHKPELRRASSDILEDASWLFHEASTATHELINTSEQYFPRRFDTARRKVGRITGRASLTLACVSLGDELIAHPEGLASVDTQILVRQQCLRALQDARTLGDEIGLAPSVAQLADLDSHLSVFWRRNAPNGALQAYETAVDLRLG